MTYSPTFKKSPSQRARQVLVSWPRFADASDQTLETLSRSCRPSQRSHRRSRKPNGPKYRPIDSYVSLRSDRELYL